MKARDFIKPGENVIVIFTHGLHFDLGDDNTGSTGEWDIDPNRLVNRVIIYLQLFSKRHIYLAGQQKWCHRIY